MMNNDFFRQIFTTFGFKKENVKTKEKNSDLLCQIGREEISKVLKRLKTSE